jgi:hypothetical protein
MKSCETNDEEHKNKRDHHHEYAHEHKARRGTTFPPVVSEPQPLGLHSVKILFNLHFDVLNDGLVFHKGLGEVRCVALELCSHLGELLRQLLLQSVGILQK